MSERKKNKPSILVPVLLISLIGLSFLTGSFWQKIKNQQEKQVLGGQNERVLPTAVVKVDLAQIKQLFSQGYLFFGDENRPVLFVEFSDPSCPWCHVAAGHNPEMNQQVGFKLDIEGGTYQPPVREMKKLVDQGEASFVWLYRNGHGNGQLASQALYCAYEKGKFWEVHNLLMSNKGYQLINDQVRNDKTKIPLLVGFLQKVINASFLTDCLESQKYADKLSRDTEIGDKLGVGGTPAFFVNSQKFAGAYSFTDMEALVKEALQK